MSNETACTRSDLIEAVYKSAKVTRNDATLIFDSFLEKMVSLLKETNEVKIPKFGSFTIKEKSARMGRNPKTGKAVEIAAHNAIAFKPSSVLKNAVEAQPSSKKAA